MTLRERTSTDYAGGRWNGRCEDMGDDPAAVACPWHFEDMTRASIFQRGRKHAAETGHKVIIAHEQEWTVQRKEES